MVASETIGGVMHGMSDDQEPYAHAATRRLKWPFMPSEAIQLAAGGRCHMAR